MMDTLPVEEPAPKKSDGPNMEEQYQEEEEYEEQYIELKAPPVEEEVEELKDVSTLFKFGNAKRIAFGIDISGSMQNEHGGKMRIEWVKMHMEMVLEAMASIEGAAFGIALFNNNLQFTELGDRLYPATRKNVDIGIRAIRSIKSNGGSSGNPQCLRACLQMSPDAGCIRMRASDRAEAVCFLGDGGWSSGPLIGAGQQNPGKIPIHSIAFFTTGGGLQEIAQMSGGTYREIHDIADIGETAKKT